VCAYTISYIHVTSFAVNKQEAVDSVSGVLSRQSVSSKQQLHLYGRGGDNK